MKGFGKNKKWYSLGTGKILSIAQTQSSEEKPSAPHRVRAKSVCPSPDGWVSRTWRTL